MIIYSEKLKFIIGGCSMVDVGWYLFLIIIYNIPFVCVLHKLKKIIQ